jgi:hypothetical protein
MATYNKLSPYYFSDQSQGYMAPIQFRDIPYQSDDIVFEVTSQYMHRPDLLAYDFYSDTSLWWVFAVRNKSVLKDPVYDLVPGQKIYIPKLTTLKSVLGF